MTTSDLHIDHELASELLENSHEMLTVEGLNDRRRMLERAAAPRVSYATRQRLIEASVEGLHGLDAAS